MSKRSGVKRVTPGLCTKERRSAIGEARAKITLTNARDEDLAEEGRLARGKIRSCVVDALVDTGSVRTVLPIEVVTKLGLRTRGQKVVEYADGRKDAVKVTNGVIVEWEGRDTIEEAIVLGDEVLIGQTVLEKLDLHVDCTNHRLIPNPAHPDQAVTKLK